jgi:hypothetical protein
MDEILLSSEESTSDTRRNLLRLVHVPIDDTIRGSYQEIKGKILPFDLIAFRGDDFISNAISQLEKSQVGSGFFSHVGMVITSEILPMIKIGNNQEFIQFLQPGKIYTLESNITLHINGRTGGMSDIADPRGVCGVQIRDIEELIPQYLTSNITKVAWCRLLNNPYARRHTDTDDSLHIRREELKSKFINFYDEYRGRLYEIDPIGLTAGLYPSLRPFRNFRDYIYDIFGRILSALNFNKLNDSPAQWQFCSELLANAYQTIGVLPNQFDPRDVIPVDFFGYDQDGIPPMVEPPVFFVNN